MLDLLLLREQFAGFDSYQAESYRQTISRTERALATLTELAADWASFQERAAGERVPWLRAGLIEKPTSTYVAPPRPTPMTVVATDGSQILPDRNVEPTCYLLNVSRIAFHYGTLEEPLLETVPSFRYRKSDLHEELDDPLENASAEMVSALRDEAELQHLYDVAFTVRQQERPLLAMADGTLIRWMIRQMHNRTLEERLIRRYAEVLALFRENRIPLCSYISMPSSAEVVGLLRIVLGESSQEPSDPGETLFGLPDRKLFERLLKPGCRSATFVSGSHIQSDYEASDRICFFYVRSGSNASPGEVGRVEFPQWVADDEGLLDLIHAVVQSECEKGRGYPMILSEAHEHAVVRAPERSAFYSLIAGQMEQSGLPADVSQKSMSKRRPLV